MGNDAIGAASEHSAEPGPADSSQTADEFAERLRQARVQAFLYPDRARRTEPGESELERLVSKVAQVYVHSVTEGTRATYARRWGMFAAWCEGNGYQSLPATPETVMLYLSDAIDSNGNALSTLRGYAAAIARVHLEAGLPSPSADPGMRLFLRGLSRMSPPAKRVTPISALRITALREVCAAIDRDALDIKEVRDRALFGLIGAGMMPAQISRLRWGDVSLQSESPTVTVRPTGAKRSPRAMRIPIVIPLRAMDGDGACPVNALRTWMDRTVGATPPDDGPVFVKIVGGELTREALPLRRVVQVIQSRGRSLGSVRHPADPQTAMRLLATYRTVDLRDRALILLGFAGAFRRNELTNLLWGDVTKRDGAGVVVHLQRSKTDQTGVGRDVGIPYGRSALTCPVKALEAWRERVEQYRGPVPSELPVFVDVGRAGRLGTYPIVPETLTGIVVRRTAAAGLEGHWGGRSLRAGFISTAADLEIPLEKVAAQSRHATLESLALYIRRLDPFRGNAAGRVGL